MLAFGGVQELTKVAAAADHDQTIFGRDFSAACGGVAHRVEAAELGFDRLATARVDCGPRAARDFRATEAPSGDDTEIRSCLPVQIRAGDGERQLLETHERIEA